MFQPKSKTIHKEDGIRRFKVNSSLVPDLVGDVYSLHYKKSNDHPRRIHRGQCTNDEYYGRVVEWELICNFTPVYSSYSFLLKTFFPSRNPQNLGRDQEKPEKICTASADRTIWFF